MPQKLNLAPNPLKFKFKFKRKCGLTIPQNMKNANAAAVSALRAQKKAQIMSRWLWRTRGGSNVNPRGGVAGHSPGASALDLHRANGQSRAGPTARYVRSQSPRFSKPARGCASGLVPAGGLGCFWAVVPAASGPVPAAASRLLQAGASGLEAPHGSTRMQGFIFMGACFWVLSATAPITADILNASVFFVFCCWHCCFS